MHFNRLAIVGLIGLSVSIPQGIASATKTPADREVLEAFKKNLETSPAFTIEDIDILAKDQTGNNADMVWTYRVEAQLLASRQTYILINPLQDFSTNDLLPMTPSELKEAIPAPIQKPGEKLAVSGTVRMAYANGQWRSGVSYDNPFIDHLLKYTVVETSVSDVPPVDSPNFSKYLEIYKGAIGAKRVELRDLAKRLSALEAYTTLEKNHISDYHGLKYVTIELGRDRGRNSETMKKLYRKLHLAELKIDAARCKLTQQSPSADAALPGSDNPEYLAEIQKLNAQLQSRKTALEFSRDTAIQENNAEEAGKIEAAIKSTAATAAEMTREIQKKHGIPADEATRISSTACLEGPALEKAADLETEKSVSAAQALDEAARIQMFQAENARITDLYDALVAKHLRVVEEQLQLDQEGRSMLRAITVMEKKAAAMEKIWKEHKQQAK